jgi:hypothetical protein
MVLSGAKGNTGVTACPIIRTLRTWAKAKSGSVRSLNRRRRSTESASAHREPGRKALRCRWKAKVVRVSGDRLM